MHGGLEIEDDSHDLWEASMAHSGQDITMYTLCLAYMTPWERETHLQLSCMAIVAVRYRQGDDHHVLGGLENEANRHENQGSPVSLMGQTIPMHALFVMYMITYEPLRHLLLGCTAQVVI